MKHLLPFLANFFSKKKRSVAGVFAFFFVCLVALLPTTVHAEGVSLNPLDWIAQGASTVRTAIFGATLSPITVVMWVIFKITSLLLGLAGVIFNWAVLVVVFEFSKYFGNSPGMTLAWGILRDFANIGLLFGFVFMGIATILDLHKYPWKQALPKLVIYAVLLNFSLFATEAIIDATNVVSATLYKQTYGEAQQCSNANWLGCVINTGLAAVVLDRIELSSVYDPNNIFLDTFDGIAAQLTHPIENILKYVMLALVTTVAATVFFGAASMLISRGITLAFLMVTSPLGFAGLAIPFLEGMARKWWKKLIDQALFAPVFILLLLASLKMTDGLDQLVGEGGLTAALSLGDVGNTTGTIIFFTLTMGFMVASLAMAQQFGIYGSDAVMKGALDVIGRVGGAPLGTAGWIGRRTIGGTANIASRSLREGRLSAVKNIPLVGAYIQRRAAGVADSVASTSFDVRGKNSGLGQASAGAQGGARGEREATIKRNEDFKKSLDEADKAKFSILGAKREAVLDKMNRKLGADGLSQEQLQVAAALAAPGTRTARYAASGALQEGINERAALKAQMSNTTEGRRQDENDSKEKLDHEVSRWNEAAQSLKEADRELDRIARALEKPGITPGEIQRLSDEGYKYNKQYQDAQEEQHHLEPEIQSLTDSIIDLRKQISRRESEYRKSTQHAAELGIGPVTVFDRPAIYTFAAKKVGETSFKPKNIHAALSRGLRKKFGIPEP